MLPILICVDLPRWLTVLIEALCLMGGSPDKEVDSKAFSIAFFLSSPDGRRQETHLKRRGSYSKLLNWLIAQLPSSIEWEGVNFWASLYHHLQHSVDISEKVLLLAR